MLDIQNKMVNAFQTALLQLFQILMEIVFVQMATTGMDSNVLHLSFALKDLLSIQQHLHVNALIATKT